MKTNSSRIEHSWIIPLYQDAAHLPFVVERSIEFLSRLDRPFEVILINDGSSDETKQKLQEIQKRFKSRDLAIQVLHHPQNLGYGAALRSGFQLVRGCRFVGYTDGDAQYDPCDLIEPCVSIVREAPAQPHKALLGYKIARRDGPLRNLQSKTYNALVRSLFHVPTKDINCSLKWFPAWTLPHLHLQSQSAFIDAEIVLGLRRLEIDFDSIPVNHFSRGTLARNSSKTPPEPSKRSQGFGAKPAVIAATLKDLLGYRLLWRN